MSIRDLIDAKQKKVRIEWPAPTIITDEGFSSGGESRGFLDLDATTSVNHDYNSKVVEHAIEEGSDITDHVHDEPLTLQLSGMISDHPLVPTFFNLDFGRSVKLFDILRRWQKQRALLTITTSLDKYENMVIESLNVTRAGPRDAHSLPLSMKFRQVITVASRLSGWRRPKKSATTIRDPIIQKPKQPAKRVSVGKKLADVVAKTIR